MLRKRRVDDDGDLAPVGREARPPDTGPRRSVTGRATPLRSTHSSGRPRIVEPPAAYTSVPVLEIAICAAPLSGWVTTASTTLIGAPVDGEPLRIEPHRVQGAGARVDQVSCGQILRRIALRHCVLLSRCPATARRSAHRRTIAGAWISP